MYHHVLELGPTLDATHCGNSFSNGGGPAPDGKAGCNMPCYGNASEICGGPNRLSVFDFNNAISALPTSTSTTSSTAASATATGPALSGWKSLGCYTDGVGSRTLETEIYSIPGADMTVELCTAACLSAGFDLAGLEYAGECYCDTSFHNGGGPAPDGNMYCDMACNGNTAETCGGPNRLNVYSYTASGTSSTTSVSGTGSSTSKSTSTTSSSTGATSLPTGWAYKGCWVDQQFGRILAVPEPDSATLTVESCIATCKSAGYSVAGMEYYTQCYCGNAIVNAGSLAANPSDCNTACGGNSAEMCGGGNRMSIYSNQTTLTVQGVPAVQNTSLPGSWKYQGCLIDSGPVSSNAAINRVFFYQLEFPDNNTATNCLSQCSKFGYGAGGMEYGSQCFCGDAQNLINAASTATFAPESDCSMPCTGNSTYLCGGSGRLSLYTWTGTALNSWDFPTGNDAGNYEFLIGGVIIPLVATVGTNNKVAFLEKFGTEPANNSTGAYELDLDLLGNFTAAWRPMHVQSDVFCSASLVLPDKVGRQINIGGWAYPSTIGVRIYWPDGEPGVWGTNDWQENPNEVALLTGRWYPTAMMMVNGSILVMGGEVGSNGAPVPSLEILPGPPGVTEPLFCEYLNRTDPYNLYPYLIVLPSGGIAVFYYNEARILNEVTLETDRVLPNIPGAVNNFLGGRTYPLEGTAMTLPQHAPYTDPLTVVICGGSIPGPEYALDNCVSIQPEVTGANWTIERMPSQRVISCIAALPDGTFIIMNGAHQGVAGFQGATDPNFNAVLYDPSKPVNQRMSVMANSTIARLYHSEATLLPDGRVLVTGSDPEMPVNAGNNFTPLYPQEYRVEVFHPPYLLSGLTKPTFTLSGTDFGYAETFTVTVHLHQGTTSGMRISLLAATSSTHGNSMGMRTIFPAFTCAGNVCTVTTPPNGHVSPPSWHQLFVLDGPTPSVSQWIRIGGDPAELGNWPPYSDFDTPGI
ncbi:hypothetical protein EG329_012797 [Mollisiaceae sp. DMI_Dod_QoI]|nr:hypothetical protein EG329_012797 [Helotiales sp. DMI_Dod_QoI]